MVEALPVLLLRKRLDPRDSEKGKQRTDECVWHWDEEELNR